MFVLLFGSLALGCGLSTTPLYLSEKNLKKIVFVLLFISIGIIYPQTDNQNQFFSINFSGGTSINNPITYYFYRETEDKLINPGLYGSLGIEYGPFEIIDLTEMFFSFSAGYTKVSTSEYQLDNFPSTAQLIIETFPILFWSKLQTDTRLSPFIEVGIGVSKLNFIERYTNRLSGASFNYWSLGYGFGAGLNYRVSPKYEIALVAHNLTNEKHKMVENDRYHLSGINVRNTVLAFSLRVNIKL